MPGPGSFSQWWFLALMNVPSSLSRSQYFNFPWKLPPQPLSLDAPTGVDNRTLTGAGHGTYAKQEHHLP